MGHEYSFIYSFIHPSIHEGGKGERGVEGSRESVKSVRTMGMPRGTLESNY